MIHHHTFDFGSGRGGCVGVVTGPIGVSVRGSGVGGFTSGLGGGTGDRVDIGSGLYGLWGGLPSGPSANTAVALSKVKNTTLSHIADLWVECAFMGVLL